MVGGREEEVKGERKGERGWPRGAEQIGRRDLGAKVPEEGSVKELESGCKELGERERKWRKELVWGGVGGTYGMLVLGWPQRLPCCAEETNSPKRADGCRGPRGSRGGGGCCRAVMEGGGETEWRSPRTVRQ